MSHQTVIVLDFGGQYNQLVRECNVYCEVKPYTTPLAELKAMNPIGIIFTGGPNSVYLETSPQVDPEIFTWGVPVLGICYGCQLMAHTLGGRPNVAICDETRGFYGVQYHPEVNHTENVLRRAVPSGGQPYRKWRGHDSQFPLSGVRCQGRLDHAGLLQDSHRGHS